ncbi:hypothetical protein CCE01nite_06550 [Cellulomonas cellasea]|uniref:GGDEF domain-containing protein n=1 Tax=Cellulomonas cellasea TaxID=43670 RepID=A0A4Y3KT06_9CELL|nr:hypothetical protein CCE01nite_06550 [Cellulomonas cellasea]
MTTTGPDSSQAVPPALRERWRSQSAESVWLRPADWYHPAVDAVVEAVLAGRDPSAAAERLGEVRGGAGVGISEAIEDLACLYRSTGAVEPPLAVVRALCEGWSSAQGGALLMGSCLDPESGLPTRDYLVTRLGETYGTAEREDTFAQLTHCLVLVDVAAAEVSPWTRMARSAAVGAALRNAYGPGHPMATLGGGLFAVLVERDPELGPGIAVARLEITHQAEQLEVTDLLRQPPRIWTEQLPRTHERAVQLLAEISR